jgi:hypothetical protein
MPATLRIQVYAHRSPSDGPAPPDHGGRQARTAVASLQLCHGCSGRACGRRRVQVKLALWPRVSARERKYADSRKTRRGNAPSGDGTDCGASRAPGCGGSGRRRSLALDVDSPAALRIVARDRLAYLLRDLRGEVRRPALQLGPRSQGAQADELGELPDRFQRAAATGAEVIDVIGVWTVAPYARPAAQASGMRHAHASFAAIAAGARVAGGRWRVTGTHSIGARRTRARAAVATASPRASGTAGGAHTTGFNENPPFTRPRGTRLRGFRPVDVRTADRRRCSLDPRLRRTR